jgi:uncharacterized protein
MSIKSIISQAFRTVGGVVLGLSILLLGCQHRLIYHPRPYSAAELKEAERRGAQQVEVMTSAGRQVAFYVPAQSTSKPFLWLICGGNGSLSLDYIQYLPEWGRGTSYLFVDYPGYGLCEGNATPDRIRETIKALLEPVSKLLGIESDKLSEHCALLGHSIGCAAGLMAVEEWGCRRAVLIAPFTTLTAMARRMVGTPLCHLNRHRFDNLKRLEEMKAKQGKAIVLHGVEDEVIPVEMSRQLGQTFPGMIKVYEVEGAMHNDILYLAEEQIVKAMREMEAF